ncbi:MAG TPA: outer membrane beta-barrel protein [Edaphocola sp.]|nr:outer membrane beta-barrel protein [Edaphocola sp.]
MTHKLTLNLSNRHQDKWQAQGGLSYALTSANYSVNKERNARYNTLEIFADLSYQPVKTWDFSIHADGTYYDAQSFGNAVFMPLVNFEISRYLFRDQRGSISLRVFDLLDKNKSVERLSQSNQLLEQQSNIIHRYAMLTFSYRFSRYGKSLF